ncbi:tetraprenyl-beta-curcumene synthase family protein [Lentibacillus salinarum]|uniref:Tetraprenyl-beta-curcumene synthase family protein n=1 Tax=Lentibacillus salinarum TaxID=446820 RepID=A0ABW3ZT87_9BACI
MAYSIPKTPVTLMAAVYRKIFPAVHTELAFWKKRADAIPDEELQQQALASIESKRFHCLGGAVYALLAGYRWREAIRFIVAYQTISDYLDNLCDRSTSLDPDDFRLLHESMADALSHDNPIQHYYAFRLEQRDGEYLADLVRTCQQTMRRLDSYDLIRQHLQELGQLYSDLQVYKHVKAEERIPRLVNWYEVNANDSSLYWYEFSAAAGSTLGIFCLVSYALGGRITGELAQQIKESYFPFMQGLHILLDYYIDQQEDSIEGDLNFCSYYDDEAHLKKRLIYFISQTDDRVQKLPDRRFHEMVYHGLVGLYLGDPKVRRLDGGPEMACDLLQLSGYKARFFHWNTKFYHRFKKTRA